jgi:hypothetical protein
MTDKATPKTDKPTRVNFELAKTHTHAGEDFNPGDVISVTKVQATRLAGTSVGKETTKAVGRKKSTDE